MFPFGGKKAAPPRPRPGQAPGRPRNLAQFGLLDMGLTDTGLPEDDDDDDLSLEAELEALTRGSGPARKKPPQKPVVSAQELDAMVASSLKDIPSDAEVSDVDDAEVEDELNELCGGSDNDEEEPEVQEGKKDLVVNSQDQIKQINERLAMYERAETVAKTTGDTVKAKRFGRGVKTLQDMAKQVKSGKTINMEDLPPPLAPSTQQISNVPAPSLTEPEVKPVIKEPPAPPPKPIMKQKETSENEKPSEKPPIPARVPVPSREAPPIPSRPTPPAPAVPQPPPRSEVIAPEIALAIGRRNEFKQIALEAKRSGDQAKALQYVRQVKICDQMISTAQQGSAVDWSQLPSLDSKPQIPVEPTNTKAQPTTPPSTTVPESEVPAKVEPEPESSAKPLFDAPPQPRSTLEALEQRLAKYQNTMEQAQAEGNSSKVRRMGRIVKQYQDAIKSHKAGKPVPFDELPTPPGFPPIPGAPPPPPDTDESETTPAGVPGPSVPAATVAPSKGPTPAQNAVPPTGQSSPVKPAVKKTASLTRQDKQLAVLLERQTMFKQAALEAKKAGEMSQAKEYLRMAKGLDPLINANKSGIPVDMDTLPIPPQMKVRSTLSPGGQSKKREPGNSEGFEILSSEECALAPALSSEDKSNLFVQLEKDLVAQLKTCTDNRDHYKLMGDLANANRFDQLALHTRKDLDVVRSAAIRGDVVPRWKNEMRTFSIVKCCTDLKDDDMEITIIRGLAYNVPNPKTIDTYVRYEIPIPNSDNPSKDKTNTIKDTNSPEYNQVFMVNISRQSRTSLRIFKSKSAKFEVWAKGGFLRSDTLIGTATVKLAELLNHCVLHEAVDLMEGRKAVGGKLEIKIRIRDPIVSKEVEQVHEKWTVLIN